MFLCSVQLHAYVRIGGSIPHKRENHEQPSWDYSNTKWRHAGAAEFLLPSGKQTWQWKMDLLKMYSLLKMVIFHCHVSLLGGRYQLLNLQAARVTLP